MSDGQTNGIPQGSVLMDLIAEIVLGYADLQLTEILQAQNITNYKILRYRDDYRIFSNSLETGDLILKCLAEIMIDLGLKLNNAKTGTSNNIITASIKPDKLYWMQQKPASSNSGKSFDDSRACFKIS